ncbi:ArsR family transcriptional regulator [Sphaerisporangium rufum]|uniref:ArsR family transcriptional regulator n=1 Tax=Sphaerisporangium rufum TaxID=1381558 RepID=A0A919QXN1_9ACTN|nr:winged helix-turn-helix domain-containing protein [Sphaerisporangium rufum]GII76011.1 ArsR family transcriptional regulator [Sphaerisporangium rufum]
MLAIEVGPVDVARTRYAISPLGEAMQALRVAAGVQAAGPLRPWAERITPRYQRLRRQAPAVDALTALFRRGAYNADFIHPPPAGAGGDFAAELAAVRATPLRRARLELARNLAGLRTPPRQVRRILDAPDVVNRLADAIEASWRELVEPDWPRLRAVLERDLVRRAGHLAMYGWAAALSDLDPRVRWRSEGQAGTIEVRTGSRTEWERHRPAGQGLLLMPTVFGTLINYVEPPWPYALVYPARGIADLLAPAARAPGGGALSRLVGPRRADVLRALDVPATTTQLAARLGLSLGTIGGHLAVLREAGLVTRTRAGRSVRYEHTPLGAALAAG